MMAQDLATTADTHHAVKLERARRLMLEFQQWEQIDRPTDTNNNNNDKRNER
jgi:hypothetical protein